MRVDRGGEREEGMIAVSVGSRMSSIVCLLSLGIGMFRPLLKISLMPIATRESEARSVDTRAKVDGHSPSPIPNSA